MDTFEKIKSDDGTWRVCVHREGAEFVYKTDAFPSATLALKDAKRWAKWTHNLPKGKADTIYYILVIPETWSGPAPGAHSFSGLHMKIGRSKNVLKRLQNLRTGTPGELIIMALEPGNSTIEQKRLKQFATDRRQGEWFVCSPKLAQHAFTTWGKNNLLPQEHQQRMVRLAERLHAYREARKIFDKPFDMVNPSLNEDWRGTVFVDLVFTNLAKKDGFYEISKFKSRSASRKRKRNKKTRKKTHGYNSNGKQKINKA